MSRQEARRLVLEGRLAEAVERALADCGARPLPADLFSVYFPSDDGRQDLVDWLAVRGVELRRLRRPAAAARDALSRWLGGERSAEDAVLEAYVLLLLDQPQAAAVSLERPPSRCAAGEFLYAVALWLQAAKTRSRALMPRALEAVERSLAADARNPYAYYVRSALRRELEDVSGRLRDAKRILALRPDFVWASIEQAEALAEAQRFEEALGILDGLVRRHGGQAWAWAQRGRLFGLYGKTQRALRDFSRALSCDPRCGPIYAWRGELRRRQGQYSAAVADFTRSIRLAPTYRLAFQWRGRVQLLLGRPAAAVRDLGRALRLDPREELAAAWLAEAFWKLGRCRDCAERFDALYPSDPRNAWNRRLAHGQAQELRYQLGQADPGRRREAQFWQDLDAVVARRRGDPWAWAFRGRCLVTAGRCRAALADFARALELDGSLAYVYRWRGECLRRMGGAHAALRDFDRAIELAPDSPWTRALRGLARGAAGDEDGALADLSAAADDRDQRFAVVHLWLSRALLRRGFPERARAAAERAFLLDGKQPEILEWRSRLLKKARAEGVA